MSERAFGSRYGQNGYAFSVDAAVAIALLASALFLFSGLEKGSFVSSLQGTTVVQDTLYSLEKTGYIIGTIDTNSPTQSALLIRQKALEGLGSGFDANVTVTSYTIDADECAQQKTFSSCFPDSNRVSGSAGGGSNPSDVYVSGRKYFLRRQPPGDCNISYMAFSAPQPQISEWVPPLGQAGFGGAYFAAEDVNVTFDVNVTPDNAVYCDQNVTIGLSISIPEDVRKAIDLMLVIDRSGSMSWSGEVGVTAASRVYTEGDYVYLADSSSGVRSISVSNPLIPALVDREDPGTVVDVDGDGGNYIFALDNYSQDQLFAINKSNPAAMSQAGSMSFDSVVSIDVNGPYAYVSGEGYGRSDSGLIIVDISNPSSMVLRGTVNTSDPRGLFVGQDNYVYLADGASGLRIINVANKISPQLTGTQNTAGTARDVYVSGNYAYVADSLNGLVVVNVANKANPSIADTYNTPGEAYAVKVVGNYAYVADNTSLQILDVSNPGAVSFVKSYATPYYYRDVEISGNYAYLATQSSYFITLDLADGPRVDNAKTAAKEFVDFNGWQSPPDKLGLSSFNTSATLNQQLTTDLGLLKTRIDSLVASGGTDIASGISAANTELTGPRSNPKAMRFEVLLSDGQSTEGDSEAAAADAAANSTTIFAIAFGEDADIAELTAIADTTGGEVFLADDANALQDVFATIALKVAELANDSNVSVPLSRGITLVDDGNGTVADGNIIFDSGTITKSTPFYATYTLNFPCSNIDVCGIDAFTFPGPGTTFDYTDSDGNLHIVDFNESVTLPFKSRDLQVEITAGKVVAKNNVSLDVRVENIGGLDSNGTSLRLYLNDTAGPPVASYAVPQLCSPQTPACSPVSSFYPSIDIASEGVIYAMINDDNAISECPLHNMAAVNCYGGPQSQVYVVDYSVWRK